VISALRTTLGTTEVDSGHSRSGARVRFPLGLAIVSSAVVLATLAVTRRWLRPAWIAALWLALFTVVAPWPALGAVEMAITVDDLPTHGPLPPGLTRFGIATQMIDALRKHAVPGVYGFVNGAQLVGAPENAAILRAWADAGLHFGNHTFSHLDLTRSSVAAYVADIQRNERALAEWSSAHGRRYFRYPYLHEGDVPGKRDAVRQWLAAHGYTIAQVTVYFADWAWNDAYVRCLSRDDRVTIAHLKPTFMEAAMAQLNWSQAVSDRLFGRQIKHILLLHVGAFTALMLDDLLSAYRAAGTTLIGLEAAVKDPAYTKNPDLVWNGERTFLQQLLEAGTIEFPPLRSQVEDLARLCR
jgi:peptidoglycan-N-acetylglucosamine deacetylase